jgi:nicotinate phosphoribosyltransferase
MSFPSELEAFRAYARNYPDHCLLLVDTYDTIASGVPNAIVVFQELRAQGINARPSIRLDSGDLLELSKKAFQMMAETGLHDPLIVASNDLDENLIAEMKNQGAKINAWGVGTHLITSHDCPSLNGVYKLVAVRQQNGWVPRMKISSNLEKATDPGRKRLVRYYGEDDQLVGDVIYREEEPWSKAGFVSGRQRTCPDLKAGLPDARWGCELMQKVFENGKRCVPALTACEIRQRAQDQIALLPEGLKRLRDPEVYPVILSEQMGRLKGEMQVSTVNGSL